MFAYLWLCWCCYQQNGAPDGVALFKDNVLVEFLSYEGTFASTGTPAAGSSTDIGVAETGTTPVGFSLQKTGNLVSGTWQAPMANTAGTVNTGKQHNSAIT
jgi:hypothetical protein